MVSFFLGSASAALYTGALLTLLLLLGYILYQQFLHPLSSFPGPFLASLTDLWQVHQFLTLKQPYNLTALHEKYGHFVRYGPDKVSVTAEEAIPLIYQKGGRKMPKTEFYDAFGSAHPNVFGVRDETAHSIRRRHMSHSFSISSVKEMEQYMDTNIKILTDKITDLIKLNKPFDLKKLLQYYVIDVLGELAFSQSFNIQIADDESLVPPVKEHSLLASATGAWPLMTSLLKQWLPMVPNQKLQRLFAGRAACAALASGCVKKRLAVFEANKMTNDSNSLKRKDILTSLILAKDPETDEKLTQRDLETEAFGFIVAGTHTTSATTTLLFYHLLHSPGIMAKCVSEIDANLPVLEVGQVAYPITIIESNTPYLRLCIRENYRVTPVFTMPLARRVTAPEGIVIAGRHIGQGTSIAVSPHAFHHNPLIFGPTHNTFTPSRWDDPDISQKSRYLMHFGLGGRQCIGKTVAQTNIYKLMTSLLVAFDFELADRDKVRGEMNIGKGEGLVSVGVSELEGELMVMARLRERKVM